MNIKGRRVRSKKDNVHSFTIENFKAFNHAVTIPIKPITLIFGPNSAGKSSILQAVRLLKQSVEGSANKPYSQAGISRGALFDFRDITELKHNSEPIRFSFPFNLESIKESLSKVPRNVGNVEDVINFIGDNFKSVRLSISHDDKTDFDLCFGETKLPAINLPRHALYGGTINSPTFNITSYCEKILKNNLPKLHEELLRSQDWFRCEHGDDELCFSPDISTIPNYTKCEDIWAACSFLFQRLEEMQHGMIGTEEMGFFPSPQRFNGSYVGSRHPSCLVSLLGSFVAEFVNNLHYIGPLRSYPERYYNYNSQNTRNYVGQKGEDFAHYLFRTPLGHSWEAERTEDEILLKVNSELEWLKAGYKIDLKKLFDKNGISKEDIFSLNLMDEKESKVNVKNVGFGFSQLLPIVVQCILSRDYADCHQTILIEQPELHLHPALQAELGDLFIRSKDFSTLMIETHSEHLILRILRRIRETTGGELPDNVPPIRPEDVAVLYVQPGDNGSSVIEIPITEDGVFARPWPNGFFSERARELF